MNLVAPRTRLVQDRKPRFPTKGTCLSIYSRCVNAEAPTRAGARAARFPWCAGWAAELQATVRGLCRGQAAAERARLRRPAALLGADDGEPAIADEIGGRFDHVLVDEYQDTNRAAVLDPAGAEAGRPRPDRGRRRRAVDLFVPRRDGAQHPRLSRASSRRRPTSSRSTATTARPQPILAAANARHRAAPRSASPRTSGPSAPSARQAAARHRARRGRPGALHRRARAGATARPARC